MPHSAALPFHLRRSRDVLGASKITTTTEKIHGLLRLDEEKLIIQWRLTRETQTLGSEIRTDEEMEPVREVTLPIGAVAGAAVRRPWWAFGGGLRLVLTSADLRAFDVVAGEAGLKLSHPAELVLRLRRQDALAAQEFTAEVALAVAEGSLKASDDRRRLQGSEEKADRAASPTEDTARNG